MKRVLSSGISQKVGQKVKLDGWVHARRDHGQIIFIDLRDRKGLVQLVFSPQKKVCYHLASKLRIEWVIEVTGKVNARPEKMVNSNVPSGTVEVEVETLVVFSEAKTPPFEIAETAKKEKNLNEELRLKYRYLDLRREKMRKNLVVRYRVIETIRRFLSRYGFVEVETPILTKSTPEGARDYLVPSRLHPGQFYALPQSPQQFKQLLMIAGLERYFQIARCFRDEDTRGDRQPEFTQLDLEMSFVNQANITYLTEKLFLKIVKDLVGFDRSLSKKLTFNPFLRLEYDEAIKKYGTDKPDLRKNKKDPNELAFVWILNWPAFEWNKDEKRYDACHHVFTAPRDQDIPLLEKDPLKVRSWQHDLVLNGYEIAGGSIRIHQGELQKKIFKLVGLGQKEIEERFGHFLRAFDYGVPPHGGIAPGLDRVLAILCNEKNIRQVIAFPKTGDHRDLTMEAPSPVSKEQLKELGIEIKT